MALVANVEWVIIRWTPQICQYECQESLYKRFSAIRGVANVEIAGAEGRATLRWKPDERFSYGPIDVAMRMVGPSIRDIRVRVRGTITHQGATFHLISLGDNSIFELLGVPLPATRNDTVEQNSLFTRALDEQMRSKLLQVEKESQLVTVEGPLFEPWRSPSLRLAIQQLQVSSAVP